MNTLKFLCIVALIFLSIPIGSAWIYTTPPNSILNTSGFFFGNTSLTSTTHNTDIISTKIVNGQLQCNLYDSIQECLNDAKIRGLSEAHLQNGNYSITNLTIPDRVVLVGDGYENTTLFQTSGSNRNFIVSEDFATLTGTNKWLATEVPMFFGLKNIRIDGNKAGQTIGNGVSFFGKNYIIDHVYIYNAHDNGYYQELGVPDNWASSLDMPNAYISDLTVDSSGGVGCNFYGWSDTKVESIACFRNDGDGFRSSPHQGGLKINYLQSFNNGGYGLNITTAYNKIQYAEVDNGYLGNIKLNCDSNDCANFNSFGIIHTRQTGNKTIWIQSGGNTFGEIDINNDDFGPQPISNGLVVDNISSTAIQIDGGSNQFGSILARGFAEGINITSDNNVINSYVTYYNSTADQLKITGTGNSVNVVLDGVGRAGNGTLIDGSYNTVTGFLENFKEGVILGRNTSAPSSNRISATVITSNVHFNYKGGGEANNVNINGYINAGENGTIGSSASASDSFNLQFWGTGNITTGASNSMRNISSGVAALNGDRDVIIRTGIIVDGFAGYGSTGIYSSEDLKWPLRINRTGAGNYQVFTNEGGVETQLLTTSKINVSAGVAGLNGDGDVITSSVFIAYNFSNTGNTGIYSSEDSLWALRINRTSSGNYKIYTKEGGLDKQILTETSNISLVTTTKSPSPVNGSIFLNQTSHSLNTYDNGNWYYTNGTLV